MYRMDQEEEEMEASLKGQEHQAAVELWNDLQSQSDRVRHRMKSEVIDIISHAVSLKCPASKAEREPSSRV